MTIKQPLIRIIKTKERGRKGRAATIEKNGYRYYFKGLRRSNIHRTINERSHDAFYKMPRWSARVRSKYNMKNILGNALKDPAKLAKLTQLAQTKESNK